jgi:hypothetical protein
MIDSSKLTSAEQALALAADSLLACEPNGTPQSGNASDASVSERLGIYGIYPLPKRGAAVSNELLDRLADGTA